MPHELLLLLLLLLLTDCDSTVSLLTHLSCSASMDGLDGNHFPRLQPPAAVQAMREWCCASASAVGQQPAADRCSQ